MIAELVKVVPHPPGELDYRIVLDKGGTPKTLGYVGLARPGNRAPINWLPKVAGGPGSMEVSERIGVVKRVQALMAEEWESYDAKQQELRDLENGVLPAEEPAATPASEPAKPKPDAKPKPKPKPEAKAE